MEEERGLDQPLQIRPGLLEHLADGDRERVIDVQRELYLHQPFYVDKLTNRVMRWMLAIHRPVGGDLDTLSFFKLARIYAMRERWATIKGVPFDTSDLDAFICFQPWKSSLHMARYRQASAEGTIPVIDDDSIDRVDADLWFPCEPGEPAALRELSKFTSYCSSLIPDGEREKFLSELRGALASPVAVPLSDIWKTIRAITIPYLGWPENIP